MERAYWRTYLGALEEGAPEPPVQASVAGDACIADSLLGLYLDGSKRAGSGLVRDYEHSNETLPEIGDHWIVLDASGAPRCILETVRVEVRRFDEVPERVAIAEGEGDLSLAYWREAHRKFFTPFLEDWGIANIDEAEVVTEFFRVVYRGDEPG